MIPIYTYNESYIECIIIDKNNYYKIDITNNYINKELIEKSNFKFEKRDTHIIMYDDVHVFQLNKMECNYSDYIEMKVRLEYTEKEVILLKQELSKNEKELVNFKNELLQQMKNEMVNFKNELSNTDNDEDNNDDEDNDNDDNDNDDNNGEDNDDGDDDNNNDDNDEDNNDDDNSDDDDKDNDDDDNKDNDDDDDKDNDDDDDKDNDDDDDKDNDDDDDKDNDDDNGVNNCDDDEDNSDDDNDDDVDNCSICDNINIRDEKNYKIWKQEWATIVCKINEYLKISHELGKERDELVKKMDLYISTKNGFICDNINIRDENYKIWKQEWATIVCKINVHQKHIHILEKTRDEFIKKNEILSFV